MFAIIRKCYHSVRVTLQVLVLGLVPLLVSAHAGAQTAVIRVDGINGSASPAGLGNGWGSNAYLYLQDALDQADDLLDDLEPPSVVQLWVRGQNDSDGFTYFPDDGMPTVSNPEAVYSFELRSKVQIYGGFENTHTLLSQRDLFTYITVLSGDLSNNDSSNWGNRSDNSYHVVKAVAVNNTARLDGFRIRGGSADAEGGGIYLNTADCGIVRCTFIDNQAPDHGGGAFVFKGAPNFINCSFLGNRARTGSTDTPGGGMYLMAADVDIVNGEFTGNSGNNGGAIYVEFSSFPASVTDIINSTFTGNTASGSGPAAYVAGTTTVNNSIFWGTSNQIVTHSGGTANVNYSDYQGGWGGSGGNNINSDPLFTDANGADNVYGTLDDDLRLNCPSPAINVGSNAALPADTYDLDLNPSTTVIPHDRIAAPRVVGYIDIPPEVVDIGAFEKPYTPPACLGDVTGDLCVNINDLLAVISAWGPCPSPPAACPADSVPQPCLNGQVNVDDLLVVISRWGANCGGTCTPPSVSLEDAEDCMDAASLEYEPFTPQWLDFVEKCIDAIEDNP